ncbi:Triacylglycerol lipase [Operophtera brumata]|uniref:Triacylglycerol lipase n=1 Tax=Operophtera brumata TaxID=104452 RepID=A0A0L7LD93_OPEBR|nr:Triacylglycerol lipase [Operophtera brumata]
MYTHIVILLIATQLSIQQPSENSQEDLWGIHRFFTDQGHNMNEFFQLQKNKVEDIFTSSYKGAVEVKDSFNEYVEGQQKKIADEVNNYVLESERKITNTFSFEPDNRQISEEEKLPNPDVVLTVPAIAQRNGYPCETHTVISQGYVLSIHRIPRTRNADVIPKNAVILHHGLFASSADWILNGPGKGLAYVLSDAGYDVWMPNMRGNKYSREHISLKTDTKAYWNFSWHDVATHDVPAIIDYIRKVKGPSSKIAYIGHSMGTTILFAMLSSRPEYNDKLVAGFALAPVAFMSDVKGPIKSLAPIASNVAYMQMVYGSHEFIPKNSAIGGITSSCNVDNIEGKACKNAVFSFCGYNEKQFNKTLLPVFLSHLGTGTSWKTVVHFAQEIQSGGKFQKFDYGARYNNKLYASDTPPEYDLSKISLPIKLFWAQNDLLSSERDVRFLYEKLPSGSEMYMVPDPNFNHIDYLWAVDAPRLLNRKVLETLAEAFSKNLWPY